MEYIVIDESKLKVICEERDLEPYGISTDSLEYGDASSRRFIEDMLSEAKIRFGFETARNRVLIQLFPDNDGGCEIFVSKLGALPKSTDGDATKEKKITPKKAEPIQKIFFFEKLDYMLEACKRLSFLPSCEKSSAFYIDGEGYYLHFEIICNEPLEEYGICALDEYSFLLEYGEPQLSKASLPFLMEYAKIICTDNAIEALGRI